jgi:mono/diheme cytochrome c family protein
MKPSISVLSLAGVLIATAAIAGDADAGRQLAEGRCAACHVTGPWRGDVFADAPPFEVIARKFPAEGADLIVVLRGPHKKMNFRPSRGEADDIAAYIHSLAR